MASQYFNSDTIAAIVTAPNAMAGLGVIRISGAHAWNCVNPLLINPAGSPFQAEKVESHKLNRCVVRSREKLVLDDALFVWMKAPHSFTGEEVIELHLHGSPQLLRRVMQELQFSGAREALPGEFSFRAFRNGKLSLEQAEAVADLISSRSEEGARRALNHLLGKPREEIARLKKELVDRLAEVEIDIDFSDQGLSLFQHQEWCSRLDSWCEKVEGIRAEFRRSQPLREGIRLALVGEPNSGKSSLFNRLLGEDRSIVSQEAGTTRDVVREAVVLGGLLFRLSDTAGLRPTENSIESQGIARSYGEVSSADVVLWVFSPKAGDSSAADRQLLRHVGAETHVIAVWNKVDLANTPPSHLREFFAQENIPFVSVSALTGLGIDVLLKAIADLYRTNTTHQQDFWISRTRHYEVLGKAVKSVGQAVEKVRSGEHFPDLLAADLRAALFCLGEITGEFTSDDLLNHIFSEFCIGK